MTTWTLEEEARRLAERFAKIKNRAAFAKEFKVPGGQSMVYQHITSRRPISLEAAIAYARGFQCALDDISPRLASDVRSILAVMPVADVVCEPAATYTISPRQYDPAVEEIIGNALAMSDIGRARLAGQAVELANRFPRAPYGKQRKS